MSQRPYNADIAHMRQCALLSFGAVLCMWLVFTLQTISGESFSALGIQPRALTGLAGIIFAPLIHGSFEHLVSNTLPVFVLGTAFLYAYPRSARLALPFIYLVVGVLVWLFARPHVHIGASGLSYGMLFFLLVVGLIRRDRLAIAVSLLVFFLYGSLIWGVFPGQPGVSFESHLAGAVCGSVLAILLSKKDPIRHQRTYAWEDEDDALADTPDFVEQLQELDQQPRTTRDITRLH